LYKTTAILLLACFYMTGAHAQGYKKESPDTSSMLTKSTETIIIIDKKTGKPIPAEKNNISNTKARKPDTVIYLDNGKTKSAQQEVKRPGDTVIIIKDKTQKKELRKNIDKKETAKIEVIKIPASCECMSMQIQAPDTLRYEDYVNFSFILKNNCKDAVWVNSGSFGFNVSNPDGTPVRQLRKLQFSKQYRYPDFVPLKPGEVYVFEFGEDPFFQYDLHANWQYKFSFTHNNITKKYKGAPNKTYLCTEFRTKNIRIIDKPQVKK
jgi:hypothetical protein